MDRAYGNSALDESICVYAQSRGKVLFRRVVPACTMSMLRLQVLLPVAHITLGVAC